jgi:hypothetical protein
MAQSNKDEGPEVVPPPSDLLTAEALGRRVAAVSGQWLLGRRLAGAPATVASPEQGEH